MHITIRVMQSIGRVMQSIGRVMRHACSDGALVSTLDVTGNAFHVPVICCWHIIGTSLYIVVPYIPSYNRILIATSYMMARMT